MHRAIWIEPDLYNQIHQTQTMIHRGNSLNKSKDVDNREQHGLNKTTFVDHSSQIIDHMHCVLTDGLECHKNIRIEKIKFVG